VLGFCFVRTEHFCNEEGRMLAPATITLETSKETKTSVSRRKKAPRVLLGANRNSGQAAGARQQLKVIFAISKKAFAFGHMVKKTTEKISVALALKMTHYPKRCRIFFAFIILPP
jgi:hypothetical protein